MTIENSYHDVLSVSKSNFMKSLNWSIDLKNTSWDRFGYQDHDFRHNRAFGDSISYI